MPVRLNGSTSGYVELAASPVAGNVTLTLPSTAGNVVVNGANSALVSGTAQASTSGTSIDFTGIPSWVKRVTVMFNGVSTNGSSAKLIQLGTSGGLTTTGYTSSYGNGSSIFSATSGFGIWTQAATDTASGAVQVFLVSGAVWVASGVVKINTGNTSMSGGDVTLSGALDRIRITTVGGTDTFDAGSINILYE